MSPAPAPRPSPRLTAVAALLVLAAARPAAAVDFTLWTEPLRLDVTETFVFAYHGDNLNDTYVDDRYYELQSRLNLALAYRRLVFSVRVDTYGFLNTPSCDDAGVCTSPSPPPHLDWWPALTEPTLRSRYRSESIDRLDAGAAGTLYLPERIALSYTGRRLEVTLGDHYVSLGRGLVLSLRKVDELGSDTDLRGGRVMARLGPFAGILVAGVTNIVNVDEATGRYAPDPQDGIVGGRAEVRVADRVDLAAQGAAVLYRENRSTLSDERDHVLLGGFSVEVPRLGRYGNLYLEYARARRVVTERAEPGDALYGAVNLYRGPLSVLLEGKYYASYPSVGTSLNTTEFAEFGAVRYNAPPTVERVLAEMDGTGVQLDVGGGRARADYKLSPAVDCHVSYGYFYDWTDPSALLDIHDAYAGAAVAWQEHRSHASISGGPRLARERANTDPDDLLPDHPAQTHSLEAHVEVVAAQALTRRLSLELAGRHRYRQKRGVPALERWNEGEWSLGLRWSPSLVAAVGYEYTSEPALPRPPCGAKVGQPVCETYHLLQYWNGQVSWSFRPGSAVRVFVGGQRGGLRCVSGVCRVFPPFQGVKAEAVVRF